MQRAVLYQKPMCGKFITVISARSFSQRKNVVDYIEVVDDSAENDLT